MTSSITEKLIEDDDRNGDESNYADLINTAYLSNLNCLQRSALWILKQARFIH